MAKTWASRIQGMRSKERVIEAIENFVPSERPMVSVTQIAAHTLLSVSTVRRALKSLQFEGYVRYISARIHHSRGSFVSGGWKRTFAPYGEVPVSRLKALRDGVQRGQ